MRKRINTDIVKEWVGMREKNYTLAEIAKKYGVSSKTVGTHLKNLKINIPSTLVRIEILEKKFDDLWTKFNNIIKVPRGLNCACGSSGSVAIKILCTKCEKQTWWGFFLK